MICFSFICKKSGKAIHSNSLNGDAVHLFLLKDGKVIERMFGNYDSVGSVFQRNPEHHIEWKTPWNDVMYLINHSNKSNGIAAILGGLWDEGEMFPTTRSEPDPNRGWGSDGRYHESIDGNLWERIVCPFHVIYYR